MRIFFESNRAKIASLRLKEALLILGQDEKFQEMTDAQWDRIAASCKEKCSIEVMMNFKKIAQEYFYGREHKFVREMKIDDAKEFSKSFGRG